MDWNKNLKDYESRLISIKPYLEEGKIVSNNNIIALLEAAIKPHDTVCLEGNNQKQADFLEVLEVKIQKSSDCHKFILK